MNTSTYIPGTKLSFNNGADCCTVLTDGNAMVTKVWGDRWWEQMRLADWLILAEGQEEDFIPIPNHAEEDEYADMPPLIPLTKAEINNFWDTMVSTTAKQDAKRPVATCPKRPIGTKFKWTSSEHDETYRIAVVTKDGICQVKAITEGGGDCYFVGNRRYLTKRTFDSEASWLASLPRDGEVIFY
jgi:hypothetical protein